MHPAQEHAATGSLTEQQGEGTRVVAAEKMTKMVLVMPDWIKWLINSHICNMLRVRGTSLHVRGTSLHVKGTSLHVRGTRFLACFASGEQKCYINVWTILVSKIIFAALG